MHAFSPDGMIKRYASPLDVLNDFMPVRGRLYAERRRRLEASLEDEVGVLTNKARFVEEVSSKEIDLFSSRPSKNTLVELLHRRGYMPRTDKEEKVMRGGKEFDYLLSIPMYSFTHEVHSKLQNDKVKSKSKLEELQKKTPEDLWLNDLATLREELQGDSEYLTRHSAMKK